MSKRRRTLVNYRGCSGVDLEWRTNLRFWDLVGFEQAAGYLGRNNFRNRPCALGSPAFRMLAFSMLSGSAVGAAHENSQQTCDRPTELAFAGRGGRSMPRRGIRPWVAARKAWNNTPRAGRR